MQRRIIELETSRGNSTVPMETEFIRVGSEPNCVIRVPDLPAHCLTIRVTEDLVRITNRSEAEITVGRETLTPGQTRPWIKGKKVTLNTSCSLRWHNEAKDQATAPEKSNRFLKSIQTFDRRQRLLLAVIAGMLCFGLLSSLLFDSPNAARSALRDAAVAELLSIGADGDVDSIQIRSCLQRGALEEARGRIDAAELQYHLAAVYAASLKSPMEASRRDGKFEQLFAFLEPYLR